MTTTEQIISLWGDPYLLEHPVHSDNDLIPLLRRGLPFSALERTMEAFSLTRDEVAQVLAVPLRTLSRRKQAQCLAADESDRLYRLTRIMAHAEQILHSKEKAADWLHRPNRALNNTTPLSLLDTDIGAAQVDDALGRLEYGLFS